VLARPLTRSDVIAVYTGPRPLVASPQSDGSKPTTKVSREHVVDVPLPGLASIAGGKFTTYRLMARDVVDAAVADFDRGVPASVTDQVPLLGADGLAIVQAGAGRLADDYRVPRPVVDHLLSRCGTVASEVLDLIGADPGLAQPLAGGHPYLRAEVAYAVTHENALHVEDVMMRRTRLSIQSDSVRKMNSYPWRYIRVQIVQFGVSGYLTGRFGVAWLFIPLDRIRERSVRPSLSGSGTR
jgi:glycerol-3-phosphate dehydrogenase